jgi:hypothetical protein
MDGALIFIASACERVPKTAWALVVVHCKYLVDVSFPSTFHKLNRLANGGN